MSKSIYQHVQDGKPATIYLIQSEEELLAMETRDDLLVFLKEKGFAERKLFTQTALNWHDLIAELSTPSFFSEQCIYDIRLPEAKLGREGANMIGKILPLASADQVLIFSLPIDWRIEKLAWFKALEAVATTFKIKAPTAQTWPAWLQDRVFKAKLKFTPEALQMLSEWVDGHLFAADQEVRKLAILFANHGEKPIDEKLLRASMVNVSHYGALDFRDAFLALDGSRALRILDRLEGEGEPPILISRLWSEDLRKAMRVYGHLRQGKSEFDALRLERLFFDRARVMTTFVKRMDSSRLYQLLLGTEIMDLAAKNAFDESPWMLFRRMIMFAFPTSSVKTPPIDWSSYTR